ncbi:probable ATP-dependent RNA helicase kurz isoform X2 [Cylas formicarius]|uniref:probable ATP-dependent RNA helicase kurz isoform X2 n=1 Tax=Cylas formicarius TaxID=197179 RepID=UPI0029585A9A|nr:probable ATP-dependent RNA helicase kurz isoform X2 [Cylas formicarius]
MVKMEKKKFNWKARRIVNTVIDESSMKNIHIDLDVRGHYDQSNQLVLPSAKRKTKIKDDKPKSTRILSSKHRKRLEKIVDKKKKKENRASLLESLQKVQASSEELSQLTSIVSVQTKGLKRQFREEREPGKFVAREIVPEVKKLNSLSGAYRKKLLRNFGETEPKKLRLNDPNVLGFESDSDSASEADASEVQDEDCGNETKEIKAEVMGDVKEEVVVIEKRAEVIEIKDSESRKVERKPAVYVDVIRSAEVQAARFKLPILAEEQQIMEVINENQIVIIAGETGSGKTTQVPQFLYEAGYAINKQIGVTEPRRVAAISMSKRVAEEMNLSTREVSYLIRFEGNATEDTKIKFMTDGVLLKEMQSDFLLKKYSVIILDEAHERSVYTDILIGFLSRVVPLRHKKGDPLKLIIMSATLKLEDFTANARLFKVAPPVVVVETRQFPVTIHFNKRTNDDYVKEAFGKAVKIHTKLPEGGVLIFVTGQREVNSLVKKLRRAFPLKHKAGCLRVGDGDKDSHEQDVNFDEDDQPSRRKKRKKVKIVPDIDLDDYDVPNDAEPDSDADDVDFSDEEEPEEQRAAVFRNAQPLWTLPLFSMLPPHKQAKVFEVPPAGCRLCVVSTNVAETSLTIPNVKYVIDCGKTKLKLYDKVTGLTAHAIHWTSKASADQRAGRAGRTAPGHCYRLYSSAVYNDAFPDYATPEIQLKPVDDLYLLMRRMRIEKIVNFPFLTAPDLMQLRGAERRLEILGALSGGQLTPLGEAISRFPVLPRFGKMLALSHQHNLSPYTVCLVAALSVPEVLLEVPLTPKEDAKETRQRWAATRAKWAGHGHSLLLGDNMVLLKAVGAAEHAHSRGRLREFCDEHGLRHKAVAEIRKLRLQLTSEINRNVPGAEAVVDPRLEPPTELQAKLLRQILLSGMGDQVARKVALEEVADREDKARFKYAYKANDMEEPVFLHQGSVLRKALPEFVVYQEIYETNRIYMRGVTAVEPEWLPTYVPHLCNLTDPLPDPPPFYDSRTGRVRCTVTGTFGKQAWPLPHIEVAHPETVDAFKWFGNFLLDGKVFGALAKYKDALLSQPGVMVKTWARLQPRTEALLKALVAERCCSRDRLIEVWRTNPKYLLPEYLKWLPESAHSQVVLLWPPSE